MCSSLTILNQLVEFHEIQQEGHSTEGDLDPVIFTPIASTILSWMRFKLLMWKKTYTKPTKPTPWTLKG
jgi:hypothetical protein